jgi:hypothetical protein
LRLLKGVQPFFDVVYLQNTSKMKLKSPLLPGVVEAHAGNALFPIQKLLLLLQAIQMNKRKYLLAFILFAGLF